MSEKAVSGRLPEKRVFLSQATQWAKEAGDELLRYFRSDNLQIATKLNQSDIVTAADKAAEKIIIEHINELYPDHSILSEESGTTSRDSRIRWIIDPLDGTTNFSEGLPLFSVSIAIEIDGIIAIGVVYAPRLNEMFHAVKDSGAWLNGHRITASRKTALNQSVVATGFPVDKDTNPDNNLQSAGRMLPAVRGLRRLGSAALDLSYVGAGFLDGYWEINLHEWDVAAGALIASEGGASVTRFRPDRNVSMLASTPGIHDSLLKLINGDNDGIVDISL